MSSFLPGQTGWVVEWQDEAGVDRANPFVLEDQVYALGLQAEKAALYREALRRHRAGETVTVPKMPGCFPVMGPAPLGLPAKREQPEGEQRQGPQGKNYTRR